ncbi:Ger(x)C family spore germination protein [Oceanobacillus massiliensis]|uniref:Ger(x)C family spore germination protein n=1 Tax=Oceanobacillus massiliensis TaxID=1465765 RepID=UPI001F0078CF|nr:Ger(x)C family spore germination protein [Oceanobacillus massiliensis]
MKRLLCMFFTLALLLVILSACWDEVELEERGFIVGIAVDMEEEQDGKAIFEMTNQLVVPAGLNSTTQGGEGKGFRNLSQTGESIFETNSAISRQASRKLDAGHLELIVLSQEVAEQEKLFADILDVFTRHPNMRRGILLAISADKASDILYVEPEHVKLPAEYVGQLLENRDNLLTTEQVRIGDVQENLLQNSCFVIPLIEVLNKETVNYKGIAVFNGESGQMVGTLEGKEAEGRNFILGQDQEGSLSMEVGDDQMAFAILNGDSKITIKNENKENMQFQVDIEVESRIAEYGGAKDIYKYQSEFEKKLENQIKDIAEATVKKVKDELQVDVLNLGNHLRIKNYDLWEEIRNDWDYGKNYFSMSDIEINVNVSLREPGNTKRVEEKGEYK